jgi:hypothetical protein
VETADANRNAALAERHGEIHGARKLIGLDAYKGNQRLLSWLDRFQDFGGLYSPVGLIEGGDDDFRIWTKHLAFAAILRDAVEASQRI